ncbi:hypothetical protein CU044_5323 [Streptomyces sp. L-9-10]|nr:hypothetical protein CU044_5323 [Streptomyces sp. L-9-10]
MVTHSIFLVKMRRIAQRFRRVSRRRPGDSPQDGSQDGSRDGSRDAPRDGPGAIAGIHARHPRSSPPPVTFGA